ncbi:MAG: hypothetical protein ACJA1D_001903 [Polaribacter sp.]|jgi:hypothetical protein
MELITGVDMSKKSLPKIVAKEIALKKKNRLKQIGSISALGYLNKPSTNDSKLKKKEQVDHQKLIVMVKDYRKKVGSKTGGIKIYTELKKDFINTNIKIGRDKFYRFLRLNKLLVPKIKKLHHNNKL